MKIAVIGASGFIGANIYRQFSRKNDTIGTFKSNQKEGLIRLDCNDRDATYSFFRRVRPDVVIVTVKESGPDWCEREKEKAFKSNVETVENIRDAARESKSKVVFFSTDYIFDGTAGPYNEEAKPNPINYYGETKLLGEQLVRELKDYLIVRVTWVYGRDDSEKNFVSGLVKDLRKGETRKVPTDQYGNPSHVENIGEGIDELLRREIVGTYNIGGAELVSRYEFAQMIATVFGLRNELIVPMKTEDIDQIARRPLRGGLALEKIMHDTKFRPWSIDEGLKKMKDEENE